MPETSLLTKELNNLIPDISIVFDTLVQGDNGLLANVKTGEPVKNIEAGWIDDVLAKTEVLIKNVSSTTLSGDTGVDLRNLVVTGAQVRNIKNADVFTVSSLTSGVLTVTPNDGSATPVSGTFAVNNVPVGAEASTRGAVTKHQGTKKQNYTQIFRRDVELSNSVLNTNTYDRASYMATQTNAALFELKEALSEAVWFGIKSKSDADNTRSFDGLYSLYEKAGGTSIDGSSNSGAITYAKLTTLATAVAKKGGKPDMLICNPAIGGKLSEIIFEKQKTVIADNILGSHASYFKNPVTGQSIKIVYDSDCPIGDLWLGSAGAMELRPLGDRDLVISDASTPDKDATALKLIKECTLFVYNINNHFGYLTGLQA